MIEIPLNTYKQKIKAAVFIKQVDHSDYERVHEITFVDNKKKVTLRLDRTELAELIGVLEILKDMQL